MKFAHIIDALYHQPLAITPAGFEAIDRMARPILFEAKRPETDFFGGEMEKLEIEDGIAIVPIIGPLLLHAGLLEKQCGATAYDDIREDLETAASRGCHTVILNIDSPGGQYNGCLELAEFIADFQEENGIPVIAFTDGQMCSAAYFLGSSCEEIFAARTASVGSIGIILGWIERSRQMEEDGLTPLIFTSGKFKATGNPNLAITPEQRDYVQGLVNSAFEVFSGHVLAHRQDVEVEFFQGQAFDGKQALAAGLIDGFADDIEAVREFYSQD